MTNPTGECDYVPPPVRHAEVVYTLIARATKRSGSPVDVDARSKFGPTGLDIIRHLSRRNCPEDQKLPMLMPPTCNDYLWAVNAVVALAVLSRFDEEIQHALEARGYRRAYVNGTGTDLLHAMHIAWRTCNDDDLVSIVKKEAAGFLGFVADAGALEAAIRRRLVECKALAAEGARPARLNAKCRRHRLDGAFGWRSIYHVFNEMRHGSV